MRTITRSDTGAPVSVQVPNTLEELASFIDSKPADEVIDLYASGQCLGAQVLMHYNPELISSFGYTSGDVRPVGSYERTSFTLDGPVWGFFDYLFHRGGSGAALETREVEVEGYICACGDPDCGANSEPHTEEKRVVTFGGLARVLATYQDLAARDDADPDVQDGVTARYTSDHSIFTGVDSADHDA